MRSTIKLISLAVLGAILIGAAIVLIYKPIYRVTLDGEKIGYCEDKNALQEKINAYMKNGEEGDEHIAFVQIDELPQYSMCLLKKGIVTNDDEIYEEVKETGTKYYRYYAISDDNDEKIYLASFDEADDAIKELKEKESTNASDLTIVEKYETEVPKLNDTDEAVDELYQEKKVTKTKTTTTSSGTVKYSSSGSSKFSTSREITSKKVNLGISITKPVSGILTSRYGYRWGRTHTGIDIGASTGTSIKAASPGRVTFAGWKGSLGNLIVITHGNGVQTYYGHCSKLIATAGQKVSTGDVIAKVGSTGRSTGSHLHFEIRVNGSALNPLSYVGY